MKRLLLALLVASLAGSALLVGTARASSLTSCGNKVINDWYDNGRIDHRYPVVCYRDALNHLPEDVKQYADAHDVITQAMAAAIAAEKVTRKSGGGQGTDPTSTDTTQTSTNSGGGGGTPSGGGGSTPPGTSTSTGHHDAIISKALNKLGPNNANSIPLPLVVLGGLALLLLAAGAAGVVARKLQERRVPGTPGGGAPPEAPSAS